MNAFLLCVLLFSIMLTSCSEDKKDNTKEYNTVITVDPKSATLLVGETMQITTTMTQVEKEVQGVEPQVKYQSSDEAIATVSNSGLVTALKAGNVEISVQSGEAKEKVSIRIQSLTITPSTLEVHKGKTLQLKVAIAGEIVEPVYSSKDETIATIDSKGIVTAIKEGKVEIEIKIKKVIIEKELTVLPAIVPTSGSLALQRYTEGAKMEIVGDNKNDSFFGAAIRFSATDLLANAENVLGISAVVLEDAPQFKVQVYEDVNGTPAATPVVTKTVTRHSSTWNYFAFDDPFVPVVGKSYWFVLKAFTGKAFLAYTETNIESEDCKVFHREAWIPFKIGSTKGLPMMQVLVAGGNYSEEESTLLTLNHLVGPNYLRPGDKFQLSANIVNSGVLDAQDFSAILTIDGHEYRKDFNGANLHNGQGVDFVIGDYSAPDQDKQVPVELRIENNHGSVGPIYESMIPVYKSVYPRNAILIDQFTGQGCPNCPTGETALENAIEQMSHPEAIVWVAHHVGYKYDDFTLEESTKLANYLGVRFAPSMALNRMQQKGYGIDALVFHPGYTKSNILEEALNYPAFASINVVRNYNPDTRHLSVTVSGETAKPSLNISVYLIQNEIIAPQANGGSTYHHKHVLRGFISKSLGDKVTPNSDGSYSKTFTYEVPETVGKFNLVAANSEICVSVGKQVMSNALDGMIYNAARVALVGDVAQPTSVQSRVYMPKRVSYLTTESSVRFVK